MSQLRNLWQSTTHFFEHGDLTPFAVVISVAHYIPVLTAHGEWWFVAALVGSLIDLLHFRTVRQAVNRKSLVDVTIALLTTGMATAYHWRYYEGDWLLALPIPVGIAILAYHASGNAGTSEIDEELIRLRTENNRLLGEAAEHHTTVTKLQTDIARLQTKIKSIQSDARRWQQMKQRMNADTFNTMMVFIGEHDETQAVAIGVSRRNIANRMRSWNRRV